MVPRPSPFPLRRADSIATGHEHTSQRKRYMTSTRRRFLLAAAAFGGTAMTHRSGNKSAPSPALPPDVASSQVIPGADATLTQRRNWGRWVPDDQMGAVNLITA